MFCFFWIGEGWMITGIVLAYVIFTHTLPERRPWLRIVVPLLISAALHIFHVALHQRMDIAWSVSDTFVSWLAAVGAHQISAEIQRHIKRKREE